MQRIISQTQKATQKTKSQERLPIIIQKSRYKFNFNIRPTSKEQKKKKEKTTKANNQPKQRPRHHHQLRLDVRSLPRRPHHPSHPRPRTQLLYPIMRGELGPEPSEARSLRLNKTIKVANPATDRVALVSPEASRPNQAEEPSHGRTPTSLGYRRFPSHDFAGDSWSFSLSPHYGKDGAFPIKPPLRLEASQVGLSLC
ncbi:unnamed protein product [Cochlearia groenlandica]